MTDNILLTRLQGESFAYLPGVGSRRTRTVDAMSGQRREGWLQRCPLSYDQAGCIHPPSVECYVIQAFSIASDFDPQLMPKIQNQIAMRKVCIVIQSLLSRDPNHHSSYSQDREKHHTLLTLKRRKNVVHDVTNVEQHELLGFDASRPLPDVIPKRANPRGQSDAFADLRFLSSYPLDQVDSGNFLGGRFMKKGHFVKLN